MTESVRASDLKRRGRDSRGITLASHKSASTQLPLAPAPLPSELILPLEGGLSARDVRPAVESGQRVLRGQPLVQGGGPLSTWAHASTSGVVRSLERRPVAHPRRREALCAVLEVDGHDEWWPELERPDPRQWDTPEKLSLALSRAGLAGLGGAVFPTGLKLAATWRGRMRLVVVNGVECEPYISCDDMLMRTAPGDVLAGALALVELTGAAQGIVVVEEDKPEALQALQRALPLLGTPQPLTIVTVPAMYPAGGERQLIQALTGHEVPSLAKPTDIGYLCQNVGTAAALFRYLQSGRPVTSRITTVTGGAVATPRNLEVRLGTRIADLVAACGGYTGAVARLIKGGTMMGLALESDLVPVGRSTNCIIAAAAQELRQDFEAMPCIRCGNCSDVCPAYLMPQELNLAAERDEFDALENLGLFDCIECGCCDVVCPSHIRLTESFRVGKRRLVQALDPGARVRWLDAREQQRRQGVENWERRHGSSAAEEQAPQQRLEAVAAVIARVSRSSEATETSREMGETNA
jgi:H+/Na+-translocating ferredoxin:NAD+ oxidoreductase subunit C